MSRPARTCLVGWIALVTAGALWAVLQALAATTREVRLQLGIDATAVEVRVDQGDVHLAAGGRALTAVARERSFLVGVERLAEVRDGTARLRWRCRLWTSCRADVRAAVTAGAAIRARTGFGTLRLDGPTGDIDMTSGTGAVEGRALTARRASVTARRGDVTLAFATAPDHVEVDVSSGRVAIEVPAGAYRIDATTRAGRIRMRGVRHDERATRSIVVATTAGDVVLAAAP